MIRRIDTPFNKTKCTHKLVVTKYPKSEPFLSIEAAQHTPSDPQAVNWTTGKAPIPPKGKQGELQESSLSDDDEDEEGLGGAFEALAEDFAFLGDGEQRSAG